METSNDAGDVQFSSMTANIAMLRMAQQMSPETTHMW